MAGIKIALNAVEVAQMLEKEGVDAITLHPRTRKQRYQEKADWPYARKVKEAINIPFILSGDVTNKYMAQMAFAHTKCDYIMIARAAKNNPSIFDELNQDKVLKTRDVIKHAEQAQRDFADFLEYYKKFENRYRFSEIQDHANWTARGCKNNKVVTQEILDAKTEDQLLSLFNNIAF